MCNNDTHTPQHTRARHMRARHTPAHTFVHTTHTTHTLNAHALYALSTGTPAANVLVIDQHFTERDTGVYVVVATWGGTGLAPTVSV